MIADVEAARARLLDALRDVEDPEIPISVVDMGLIVGLDIADWRVHVDITFTAMGCPAVDMILDDVRERLLREPDVDRVDIDVVWDPIWTPDRISDDGKATMREWGISI